MTALLVSGLLGGAFGLVGVGLATYWGWIALKAHSEKLAYKVRRVTNWVIYWALWGSVFGAIGAGALMRLAKTPESEAVGWIIFGVCISSFWGAVWGGVFGITEQQRLTK